MIKPCWISLGLLTMAAGAAAGFVVQRPANSNFRAEAARLQEERCQWANARAEHERLLRDRVPEMELERLRADHAALVRLRAEVAEMKTRVAARQAAAERPLAGMRTPVVHAPPALTLEIGIGADGLLRVDGSPSDPAALEQRLAALVRGTRVEVLLAGDPAQFEQVSQTSRQLMAFAKEHGLRMEVKFGRRGR